MTWSCRASPCQHWAKGIPQNLKQKNNKWNWGRFNSSRKDTSKGLSSNLHQNRNIFPTFPEPQWGPNWGTKRVWVWVDFKCSQLWCLSQQKDNTGKPGEEVLGVHTQNPTSQVCHAENGSGKRQQPSANLYLAFTPLFSRQKETQWPRSLQTKE